VADIELLTQLRQLLVKRFSDGELHTLCFDLGVEYDDLPGSGRSDKARELVTCMDQHDRLADLVRVGRGSRPDVPWPVIDAALVKQPPIPGSAAASAVKTLRREAIENRLTDLGEEYKAANRQLSYALSEVDRLRIKRQMAALDEEMKALTAELETLG
jgi:hypothetical protein